jgi:hypothetical protein
MLARGGDVVRGQLPPESVDLGLRAAAQDGAQHALELVQQPVADRRERGVVDVDEPVEADVRPVGRAELDRDADRPHRQVAVQPRGHHARVLAIRVEQRDGFPHVGGERAVADLLAAVVEDGRALQLQVDGRDRRVRPGDDTDVEQRVDRRRQAAGEERRHPR